MNEAYLMIGFLLGIVTLFVGGLTWISILLIKKSKIDERIAKIQKEKEEITLKIELTKANTKTKENDA